MYLLLLLAMMIAIVVVLFAVQNASIVTLSFLSFHLEGSLAFIIVVVFSAGLIAGMLMMLPSVLRKSMALHEQKKKVKEFEKKTSGETPLPPGEQNKSSADPL